jgi:hypothetical protein
MLCGRCCCGLQVQNREDQMRVVWEHGPPTFPIDCPDGVTSLTGQQQQQQQEQQGEDGSSDAGGCGDQQQQQQQQQQQKALGVAVGSGSSAQLAGMWDDELPAAVVAPQMPTTPSAKAEPASSASAAARTASNCSNLSAAAAAAAARAAPVDSPSSSSNRDGAAAAAAPSGSANSGGTNSSTFDEHTARLPLPQQKDSLLSIKRMTDVDVIQHWKNFLQVCALCCVLCCCVLCGAVLCCGSLRLPGCGVGVAGRQR